MADLLVPNQTSESHKRFIWRRLQDIRRYFPLLVARSLHVEAGASNGGFADSPWKRILLVRLAFTSAMLADFGPHSSVSVPKLCPTFPTAPYVRQFSMPAVSSVPICLSVEHSVNSQQSILITIRRS
jgi:hypothetical protein